jgi:hypothetical protein
MVGYNSFRRKRIYRAQKAREAKIGEGVECTVCGEGKTMDTVVGRANNTLFTIEPSDDV